MGNLTSDEKKTLESNFTQLYELQKLKNDPNHTSFPVHTHSHITSQDRPHTVGHDIPHTVGQDRPHAVSQDRPHAVGQDRPHRVGQDRPHAVSQDRPHAVGQDRPRAVGQDRPHVVGQDRPRAVGQDRPHAVSQNRSVHAVGQDRPHISQDRPAVGQDRPHTVSDKPHVLSTTHMHTPRYPNPPAPAHPSVRGHPGTPAHNVRGRHHMPYRVGARGHSHRDPSDPSPWSLQGMWYDLSGLRVTFLIVCYAESHVASARPVHVNQLMKDLMDAGFIGGENPHLEEPVLKVPNLTLTPATLKQYKL